MSIFSLPQSIVERVLATVERIENAVGEMQLLIREVREEVAAVKALREKLLK